MHQIDPRALFWLLKLCKKCKSFLKALMEGEIQNLHVIVVKGLKFIMLVSNKCYHCTVMVWIPSSTCWNLAYNPKMYTIFVLWLTCNSLHLNSTPETLYVITSYIPYNFSINMEFMKCTSKVTHMDDKIQFLKSITNIQITKNYVVEAQNSIDFINFPNQWCDAKLIDRRHL